MFSVVFVCPPVSHSLRGVGGVSIEQGPGLCLCSPNIFKLVHYEAHVYSQQVGRCYPAGMLSSLRILCSKKSTRNCFLLLSFACWMLITARKRSLGQGDIFSSVCHELCKQGGSVSVHAGIHPPPEANTPGSSHPRPDSPQEQNLPETGHPREKSSPPSAQCMLGDTVNKRAVCILLEGNLVHYKESGQQSVHYWNIMDGAKLSLLFKQWTCSRPFSDLNHFKQSVRGKVSFYGKSTL